MTLKQLLCLERQQAYKRRFFHCQLTQALGAGKRYGSELHHIISRRHGLEAWCNYAIVHHTMHHHAHSDRPVYCRAALLCWKWEKAQERDEVPAVLAPDADRRHWDRELMREYWGIDPVGWLETVRQQSKAGTGERLPKWLRNAILDVLEGH